MKLKRILTLAVVVILVGTAVFLIWASIPLGPMPEAEAALQSDEQVTVTLDPWITFSPVDTAVSIGFIFYPGERVDARSYAPPARAIAEEGYLVIIPSMPFNWPIFDLDAADAIIAAHNEITSWVIGGHSLGGTVAADYVSSHPGQLDGLVLWGAYPAKGNDNLVYQNDLPTLYVYGTEDGNVDKIWNARFRLPPDTQWMVLEGGDHAQFGWYGRQSGDGTAKISREDQQAFAVRGTTALLASIADNN